MELRLHLRRAAPQRPAVPRQDRCGLHSLLLEGEPRGGAHAACPASPSPRSKPKGSAGAWPGDLPGWRAAVEWKEGPLTHLHLHLNTATGPTHPHSPRCVSLSPTHTTASPPPPPWGPPRNPRRGRHAGPHVEPAGRPQRAHLARRGPPAAPRPLPPAAAALQLPSEGGRRQP